MRKPTNSLVEASSTESNAEPTFHDIQAATINSDPILLAIAVALAAFDPDEDEETWSVRRLGPMARYAQKTPLHATAIKWLAMHWSSGGLRGMPARSWATPDPTTGRSKAWTFDSEWKRLMRCKFKDDDLCLNSLCHEADEADEKRDLKNGPWPTIHLEAPSWEAEQDHSAELLLLH
ncbi:hypothetical protein J7U46_20855 [Pelomonas sp. V22]|uniref:hypothetical protein n=1 Tax=Pelomonas sp. V22 TaxID=2822139 RepID=UPI0024A977FE|nr:hypothetical protein [Pelomonas sp. V22]MDI4635526.1 hypothetical protein [Pelomonas sp. V22]